MKLLTFILKTYLFFFNIFLWLVAVAVLAGVAYYFYVADQYKDVAENRNILVYTVVPLIVLVLVAIMIFIVSVLGLISACFNVKALIFIYGILLAVVVGLQVAGGVLVIFFKGPVLTELGAGFIENLPTYNASDAFKKAVDTIQEQLQCCGVNSYEDWEDASTAIPESCCRSTGCDVTVTTEIYEDGCLTKLSGILEQSAAISISVAIILALIQFSGVVVAFILVCCCWKEQDERVMDMKRQLPKY